jgi:hypothetical protein
MKKARNKKILKIMKEKRVMVRTTQTLNSQNKES